MRAGMSAVLIALIAAPASAASGVEGTWRTEAGDDGGYLEIRMGPCESDASKTCGTIARAHDAEGVNPDYEHLGKPMVKDMRSDGAGSFSGGTIWDPQKDKTYKSKMKLNGDELEVEGCIAFLCDGQDWTRVQ